MSPEKIIASLDRSLNLEVLALSMRHLEELYRDST
jgi:hypothetical protein